MKTKKVVKESVSTDKRQLLIDTMFFTQSEVPLKESYINDTGKRIVTGKVQAANKVNQNGRKYPINVLKQSIDRYVETKVKQRRALGELDHPDSSVIELKNTSHNIIEMWWKGDDVYAKIEILPTPSGNILKALLDSKVLLGISSRGLGSVKPLGENIVEVEDDFEILCWDFVSDPSTHGAFMTEIKDKALKESKTSIKRLLGENKAPVKDKYKGVNELMRDIICSYTGVCKI